MLIGGTLISSIELHGNISLVIFFAKCPLRCPYCHNGEILENGEEISFEDIKKTIDKNLDYIDAIVITGGEPLLQLNDLIKLLKYIKSLNRKIKLDTSGIYPERIKKILDLNLIDYIALDVKAPFNKYEEIIGTDIGENVKKSMEIINNYPNVTLEIRTTFVPTLLNKNDIKNLVLEINADIYTLQQFRNKNVLDKSLENIDSPNPHELKEIASSLKDFFNGKIIIKSSEFGEEVI
ncbi:MAG: anaerobic ribonucleoside-triphosphate reductase activating protein [Methanobacteriaceae archaeon]|jgi:pyruvate formate lyase activating enzyme|nr:anaerobic ribonucleoside-triphosphate reductase activating protein [Methanobacteriaceae archaeon]